MDSFFIIAFASYVESQTDFSQTFFEWLQVCCSNVAQHTLSLTDS